ncbi:hypothetical protein L208DRAFT_1018685, partial [Tricholoma matsutake]
TFQFFQSERNPTASFIHGCFPGDLKHLRHGLEILNFVSMKTSLPFILQLPCAHEVIFDVMLSAYITGLKVYYSRSQEQGKKQGSKRPSLDGWNWALQSAEHALAAFREAEGQRKGEIPTDLDSADATVDQALLALQERYKFSS